MPLRPVPTLALLGLLWCGWAAALEPARLGDGPDHDRCFGLLRTDAEAARFFADGWEAGGGGDDARHCAALALLALDETEAGADRLEDLARRSTADPAVRAALFAEAANAWMLADDADRAYGAATMALTLAPDDPALAVDRAVALGALRRWAEALEDLDRAVALAPSRPDAWVLRAGAERRLGRMAEAERDVAKALALAPDDADALLERAALRRAKGDIKGARADWERVVQVADDAGTADLARRNLHQNPLPSASRRAR